MVERPSQSGDVIRFAGSAPEVLFGHAMRRRQERRIADRPRPERIELRGEMAVAPDRLRQVDRADRGSQRRRAGLELRLVVEIRRRRPLREERTGFRVDRLGILPVAVVELENVPTVEAREPLPRWHILIILTQAPHHSALFQ